MLFKWFCKNATKPLFPHKYFEKTRQKAFRCVKIQMFLHLDIVFYVAFDVLAHTFRLHKMTLFDFFWGCWFMNTYIRLLLLICAFLTYKKKVQRVCLFFRACVSRLVVINNQMFGILQLLADLLVHVGKNTYRNTIRANLREMKTIFQ